MCHALYKHAFEGQKYLETLIFQMYVGDFFLLVLKFFMSVFPSRLMKGSMTLRITT